MTANKVDPGGHRPNWIAVVLIGLFAIAAVGLTRPTTSAHSPSSVSGLMALKASAQTATPYQTAMADPYPTLIEFYADWCTTCQAMAPTLQALRQRLEGQVNFVMLNIDDPQWQPQVQQFHVNGVPHLALLNSDGSFAGSLVGRTPLQPLMERVANLS
ncbi:MAG: thioredoxin domain-containing protein [Cyanobacteria bacterium P01_A01_bin.135]